LLGSISGGGQVVSRRSFLAMRRPMTGVSIVIRRTWGLDALVPACAVNKLASSSAQAETVAM
jgi:hypothetical protein